MRSAAGGKLFACALALLAAFIQIATLAAAPLRVATFNIKGGLATTNTAEFANTAAVLNRLGADVIGFQELENDSTDLQAMGSQLGLPHRAYQALPYGQVGLLSRYPVTSHWVEASGMTRPILLARIDVPGALRDPWVAVVHLKCCGDTGGTEQYTRAVEIHRLRQALALRADLQDPVILMGDFNLVADNDWTYQSGTVPDVPYPLFAPADADGYFVPEGIFKLDARHAGTGGETWTWRSNGIFESSALDHIMVNQVVRVRGTAVEIYNAEKDAVGITGLPKQGSPLAAGFAYISDHLPVFADLDLEDGNPTPGNLVVSVTGALAAEGPRGGPFAPARGTYVLSNTGSYPLDWVAENNVPWLSLSATEGTLASGDSVTITASLLPAAASLPVGGHQAALRFVNTSNGLGTTSVTASLFVAPFIMDGFADAPGYTLDNKGISLRVAVRGSRLYVATQSAGRQTNGNDHHILIADSLLGSATTAAPWAKRGSTALPQGRPFLAAEGSNNYAGWFNAKDPTRLRKSTTSDGVLEGSIDMVEEFGSVPEFIYLAAVAYQTSNASSADPSLGRVVSQVPAAVTADDNITPDEFLRIPVRSVTDSAADGRFDVLVPGRGFAAAMTPPSGGATELRWRSVPGRSYRVWHSSNLAAGIWDDITTVSAGANEWEKTQPVEMQGSAFYRVELLAPGL
jgi:endonuclease/exonuclease/phosphatase family metal-dependent hydrolase